MTAVAVSVVGVLGTILGGALTALVAARSARRGEAALERQQRLQERERRRVQAHEALVEHQRWRRERRQIAYLSFLESLGAADRSNQAFFRALEAQPRPSPVDEERVAEIRRRYKEAEAAGLVVVLEGPALVAELTLQLIVQFSALVQHVRDCAEAHSASSDGLTEQGLAVHAAGLDFLAQRAAFLAAAREALDEVAQSAQESPDQDDWSPGRGGGP
ncbi:hypothetical protein AB0J21_10470 [Streptomyces sp. NPDC049954]|uniref:hypothetical protein n=1 Tax=Streptomyces sp. NPDC049954 TaxID=3155779 RepID=UPI003441C6E6